MTDCQDAGMAGACAALRQILREAAAARSALCENELVIRLDNIMALAKAALDAQPPESGA